MEMMKYYFVLGSENFFYKQEPLEEIFRERTQNFNKKGKLLNFWIVPNPEFLKNSEFSELKDKLPKNPIAIVSTEKNFILWLKLRLNNVLLGNLNYTKDQKYSPLKSY